MQGFFCSNFFFKLLPKFNDFINSDDCIGTITSKSIRLQPVKKKKIQVITFMTMLTCPLENIFNPMRYTGYFMTYKIKTDGL